MAHTHAHAHAQTHKTYQCSILVQRPEIQFHDNQVNILCTVLKREDSPEENKSLGEINHQFRILLRMSD